MRRLTAANYAPDQPEHLELPSAQARLGVKALAYYMGTAYQTLETNWPSEAHRAFAASPEQAAGQLEAMAAYVGKAAALGNKLLVPAGADIVRAEIDLDGLDLLGSSLFAYGNSGRDGSMASIQYKWDEGLVSEGGVHRERLAVTRDAFNAYELYEELRPILTERAVKVLQWNLDQGIPN